MILCLDCGNSRFKWGLAGAHGWVSQGNIPNQEIGTLALRDWQNLPRPMRVIGVNVAGEALRVRVEAQLVRWRLSPEWIVAREEACGVINRYARPSQLGPDRWAALIAVRARVAEELFPSSCIVVNAGTALTADALDATGVFRGGIILPGMNMMLQALAANTAALKVPPGRYHDFPINTADALYSGVVHALCGAVEQMREHLGGDEAQPRVILSGGAAAEIATHLTAPVEVVDNLVLEGVLALAEFSAKA
ncbi:MAG TPA: type III pantothenate kinase [Casimicrobiaceae bacterium]|nr:type III pantothenate kinase [Casimicrobiaceae bacterium]